MGKPMRILALALLLCCLSIVVIDLQRVQCKDPCHKAWDVDWDGKTTDIRDIAIVARAFGSTPESPNWNPFADITGPTTGVPDGKVDDLDLGLVARHWRQSE